MTHPASNPDLPMVRMEEVSFGSMREPGVPVAEHVTWSVHRGDFWVVAGLHGSGKSDLLMVLGGLMPPLGGKYWFLGEPMPAFDDARLSVRLKLGLVFETGQLFNQLTVRENIALPLRYHANLSADDTEEAVQAILDPLEIGAWADATPGALGRNIQKRVGLARALALKPELLLVDNPLGGLDPLEIQWWLNLLRELATGHPVVARKPITLIVSASDLRPWRGFAHQCAVLRGRSLRVLEKWGARELVTADWTREFMPES